MRTLKVAIAVLALSGFAIGAASAADIPVPKERKCTEDCTSEAVKAPDVVKVRPLKTRTITQEERIIVVRKPVVTYAPPPEVHIAKPPPVIYTQPQPVYVERPPAPVFIEEGCGQCVAPPPCNPCGPQGFYGPRHRFGFHPRTHVALGLPGGGYIPGAPRSPAECAARGGHDTGRGCAGYH